MTPRNAYRWGIRTMVAAGPLALLMLGTWGLRMDLLGARPQLVLMAYMLLLLVAVGGFCVAVLASCHMAIAKAFSHGYATGVQVAAVTEQAAPSRGGKVADLRVVE